MRTSRTLLLAALLSMAPTAMVLAQSMPQPDSPSTQTEPSSSQTDPSSASSPSQRAATSKNAPEAATTDNTNPSAASSPHQQQATRMASKQAMKDCIAKQQADKSGMSAADAKKACKAQLKGYSG